MIPLLKKIQEKRKIKKDLVCFLEEMEQNLETFYVMDQRRFITQGFALRAWDAVKELNSIKKHESIIVCIRAFERFNVLFKEHKDFEQWYSADLERKTPENARKLHGMKHELDKQLESMESLIIPAGKALEKEMLDQGLIKT